MRIYHKRKFAVAIVSTVVSAACLVAYFAIGQEERFVIVFFLTLVYAGIEYHGAFSKSTTLVEPVLRADERDVFVAMRSSQMALRILNWLVLLACIASALFYAVFPGPSCLAVIFTLFAVSLALFVVVLFTNLYYEKRG